MPTIAVLKRFLVVLDEELLIGVERREADLVVPIDRRCRGGARVLWPASHPAIHALNMAGFRAIFLEFDLRSEADAEQLETLRNLTGRYCVVLQGLAGRPALTSTIRHREAWACASRAGRARRR